MKRTLIFGLMFLFLISNVIAIEPTQQFNKIFLEPFYRASTSLNTNYNYTININPPDGITNVKSAIITFKVYMTPTVTFNLTVDGQHCNNPLYTVSTTYSSAGQGEVTFDCSNRITQAGTYNLVLRPTQANTGAITGWLDLTYMNSPLGSINVHGTEYIAGDDGKMFLQFLDSEEQPVNNSECFINIWYPNSTKFLNNSLMSYLDEGIYYKSFLVPEKEGVYPASAKCYKPIKFNNIILYNQTADNFESNSWIGGYNWSECPLGDPDCQNGWDYDLTKSVIVSSAGAGTGGCYGSYCARIDGSYGFIERGFPNTFIEGTKAYNITFRYKFNNFQTNELAEVFVFDGNWHLLEQIGLTGGRLNGIWYNASYYIDDSEFNLETVLLGFFAYTMPSSNDYFYIDDVYVHYIAANITLSNETQYQVLRGSGEVHISKMYGELNKTIYHVGRNETPQYVWNYTNRTLTYYPPVSVNNTAVAEGIWNYTNRSLTYYPDMTNYTRIDNTIYAVNLTLYNKIVTETDLVLQLVNSLYNLTSIQISNVPGYVWNATNRNLTYYPDMTNYTKVITDTWNYTARYIHGTII